MIDNLLAARWWAVVGWQFFRSGLSYRIFDVDRANVLQYFITFILHEI
jgi:hypothetical protein